MTAARHILAKVVLMTTSVPKFTRAPSPVPKAVLSVKVLLVTVSVPLLRRALLPSATLWANVVAVMTMVPGWPGRRPHVLPKLSRNRTVGDGGCAAVVNASAATRRWP